MTNGEQAVNLTQRIRLFRYLLFGILIVAPAALVGCIVDHAIIEQKKLDARGVILAGLEGAVFGAGLIVLARLIIGDRPYILLRTVAISSAIIPLCRGIFYLSSTALFLDEMFFEAALTVGVSLTIATVILRRVVDAGH
jgi:hypothetical protein